MAGWAEPEQPALLSRPETARPPDSREGCGLGLTQQGRCLQLHHFNLISLLQAAPPVRHRSTREGEHMSLFCRQEFETLP